MIIQNQMIIQNSHSSNQWRLTNLKIVYQLKENFYLLEGENLVELEKHQLKEITQFYL